MNTVINYMNRELVDIDKEVAGLIEREMLQQRDSLQLIASSSITPLSVQQALGSILSFCITEGYPGKRYHAGTKIADEVENLAISRAKLLFGADHANVQPHMGTHANLSVYLAALKPGDTVLAMSLDGGGHLTHGHNLNQSGILYKFVYFGLDRKTEMVDYNEVQMLARRHRPRMLVIGSSTYSRLWDWQRLRSIADDVSALLMTDIAHLSGLIAGKAIPSPIPYADFVTSSCYKTLCGTKGAFILCKSKFQQAIDRGVFPGTTSGIQMNNIAAKAVIFGLAMKPEFSSLQHQIIKNAKALAQNLHTRGFRIVSGGTDDHCFLVDLRDKGITGNNAQNLLEDAGMLTNKNLIPYDTESPNVTSGIRLGLTSLSCRGMKEGEMNVVAGLIDKALDNRNNLEVITKIREEVRELCRQFPLPKYGEQKGLL